MAVFDSTIFADSADSAAVAADFGLHFLASDWRPDFFIVACDLATCQMPAGAASVSSWGSCFGRVFYPS